ncbi:MAG: trehalose-6-phosphate synthase [Acidobacteriota bacterium]
MSRLLVVSNRLPAGRPVGTSGELEVTAGGLVPALLGALADRPGSVWIGWDSRAPAGAAPTRARSGGVELVGVSLGRAEVEGYYDGFCNQALWPLLHCFLQRVVFERAHVEAYLRVQERFADVVAKLASPGDAVWIHDYHLVGLGAALRRRGVAARIGFFLHTPFPPEDVWSVLPGARRLLADLSACDLVAFHTRRYLDNYVRACERELGARWNGEHLIQEGGSQRVAVHPVGIEPDELGQAAGRPGREGPGGLARFARGRKVILGVDRLDYTKGLVERFRAFELLLAEHPEWHDRVTFVQIASPTRGNLASYAAQRRELEELVGRINGRFGRVDWVPIRYLYRSFPRSTLARYYRAADVALVTPLRDGMNLVAKEYVACQDPEDPGALVLSRFAGAAERMADALLVNPYFPAEVAGTLHAALELPLEERRRRHARLLAEVRENTSNRWADGFLADLGASARDGEELRQRRNRERPVTVE